MEIELVPTDIKITYENDEGEHVSFMIDLVEACREVDEAASAEQSVLLALMEWFKSHGHELTQGQVFQVYHAVVDAWEDFKKKLPQRWQSRIDSELESFSSTPKLERLYEQLSQASKQKTSSATECGDDQSNPNGSNDSSSKLEEVKA